MILVGGVGHLYLGDLDLGRHAAERLSAEDLGPDVVVEDLYYGALAFAQLLEDRPPDTLLLVGATERGRESGTVTRRRVDHLDLDLADLQGAVHDAGTGHVALDLIVEVAWALDVLPGRTVVFDVEPARTQPAEELSRPARVGLERALTMVRAEIRDVRSRRPETGRRIPR